jgi:hypothetical protein
MREKVSLDEMIALSKKFADAFSYAKSIDTDTLLKEFDQLEYKAFGYPAVMIWRIAHQNEPWTSSLRNDINWEEPTIQFDALTPKESVEKLYAWCVHKGYLSMPNVF